MASRSPRPVRNRRAPPPRMAVRGGFPGWAWLLLGLALGAAGAALFYISQNRPSPLTPAPGQTQPVPAAAAPAAPSQAASVTRPPAVPAPAQDRYDFYKLLKEGEVIIPEPDKGKAPAAAATPAPAPPGTPPAAVPSGGFILQAGSYRSFEDADRVKASLALLGVDGRIEKAVLKTGETWYRLRIGPLTDPQQVETLRARLKDNGINALLIRVDG
ncbi:MAG: SPOR domain-containing protein [Pseudomonadota bacterium]